MTADRGTAPVSVPPVIGGRWPLRRARTLAGRRLPALALAIAFLGAGAAFAAWTSTGQLNAPVAAATVNASTAPTVGYSSGAVSIGWDPVTLSDGTPVDRYEVLRHAGAATTVVCTATAPTVTCLDPSPVVGTVEYGVVARKSTNWAGPESLLKSFTSDQVKPVSNASSSPAANGAGWNNTAVTVTLTATDSGGSGVKQITYSVDGAAPVTVTGASTSFPVSKEGSFPVTYYAEDHAGNVEVTKSLNLKVDTEAPAAPVLTAISNDTGRSATDGITNASTQTVSGTAEPGSTVVVKRGTTTLASVVASGAGTFTTGTTTLASGANTFTATATDPAGNVSSVSTSFIVTLDTTAPAKPALTTLSSDTGYSSTDEITNVASQTLNGTAEANSTVTVQQTVPGPTANLGTTTATGSGTFAYAHTFTVNQSTTLVVTATDAAGNVSVSSNAYPVVVDQLAPTHTVTSVTPAANAAGWHRTAPSVLISSTDVGLAGAYSVSSKLNGNAWGTTTATTRTVSSGYAQGTNTILYHSTDRAGNTVGVAGASTQLINFDNVAPAKPTIVSISNDTGTSGTDRITNAASQTLSGTAEANSTVKVIRGGTTVATGTANGSGAYSVAFTLVEGANSLTVTATDVADNVSVASNAFVVTLDTTMATPTFTGISVDTGVSSSDQVTNVAAQTLSGTAKPSSTVVIKRGAATLATVTATTGGTFSASVTLVSGTNALTATSSDVAGNSVTSATFPVVLDATAPSAPVFTAISDDTGTSGTDRLTNVADQMLIGTAEPGSSVAVTRGAATLATVTANAGGTFSAPVTLLDGVNNFNARATDLAGNVSPTSTSFTVTLDTTAPATPVISGMSNDTGASGSDLVTRVAAQTVSGGAEPGSTVRAFRNGTLVGSVIADGSGRFAAGVVLVEGVNTINVIADDLAGNSSARSADLVVNLDTVAPTGQLAFPVEGGQYTWRTFAKGCAGGRDSAVCGTADDAASPFVSGLAGVSLVVYRKGDGTCIDGAGNFSTGACGTPLAVTPGPTWEHDLLARLQNGFYAATVTVTDVAGNAASATVNFEIN